MKNKKNNRSPAKHNPSGQPRPSPSYTFVPPTIPFYPPPPPPWSAFPGAWPGPPPVPPPGYQTAMPPPANGPPLANLPPNAAPGRLAGHSLSHPPFGLWPPPGAYPPPPMMMGAVMPPTNVAQGSVVPPISAHSLVMLPTLTTQGAVVPPTSIHETIVNAPVDGPSRAAPPLRKRPITRRSAAQDQAANASAGQSLEPALPSLTASKGSLTRRVKSHKHKDKEERIHLDQDKLEANAAAVDESIPSDVKESSKEEISTTETSGREDNNASLPKLGSEPYVGLRFSLEDEAYEFYNAYAKEKGFGIRKSHIQRSRVDRSVISREYVCANQGFRSTNDRRYKGKVVRPRRETRVDCRAAMSIKRRSGKWVVDKFHKEHNHGLVDPAKAEKLRSHRKITHTTKSVIDTLYKCRIGPSKIIDVLTKAAAGENKVEISGLDLLKYVKKKRKNNIAVDLYSALEYFQGMQAVDPGFFYAVEVGENRSMRSIFWADSRAREAYKQFGDVLVFDAICGANKDLFPFVSFIGVNHHRQPVLFGCGLMADETTESFVWLFETLLRSMSNRHPTSVITNQDKAILVAIEKVFPKTRHRFCMCQIEKSELEFLSHVFNMHPDFQDEYKKCIYNSRKPEEFESSWKELCVKYSLKENNWLNGMYDQRQHWVPLYLRDTFFAGMTTTHLTEGVNSYFDGFLHEGTLLNEFLRQYQQAVERRREEETDEDFMTMYTSAGSTSKNSIEEQAAKAYTRNMFTMFGHEFFESSGCISRRISEESNISKYLVGKYSDKDDDMSVVTFNSIDSSANCSCQMFEFEGLLCSHVLKVFQELNIIEIPSKYILKRWTMSARYSGSCNDEAEGVSEDPTTVDAWTLKETAVRFVEFGVTSTERVNVALNIIEEGMRKIALVNVPVDDLPSENLGSDRRDRLQEEQINDTTSCDPQPFDTKDCHTSLKTKLGVKPSPKKKRKCSTCKKTGHYTSTCPKGPVDPSQTSTNAAGTC